MRFFKTTQPEQGFSLVEVLLAIGVFTLIITAVVGSLLFSEEATALAGQRARAVFLAQEGLEAARNIRDDDFDSLTISAPTHGVAISSDLWSFSGTSDITDSIFTRVVTVSSVDSDRKQVTSAVSWQQNPQRTGSVALVTYLTNWQQVALWINPSQEAQIDISGAQNGWRVQTSGNYAYAVRAGGNPDFIVVDISTPASPSLVGSIALAGRPEDIAVSGSHAYVASRQNNQELQVVDISTPASPSVVGTLNLGGNANGNGIFVNGSTAYLVRTSSGQDEFNVIDISTPASPSLTGSVNLGTTGNEVVTLGNHAYVSADGTDLQVVDISTPASPSVAGSLDLSGGSNADPIAGFSSTVLLGRANGEFHVIDVSTPTAPSSVGSYNAGDNVNDISVDTVNSYAFIGTDSNTAEFQVIDISTPSSPSLLGSLDNTNNGDFNGVAYNSSLDRVVAVSEANAEEFIVVAP